MLLQTFQFKNSYQEYLFVVYATIYYIKTINDCLNSLAKLLSLQVKFQELCTFLDIPKIKHKNNFPRVNKSYFKYFKVVFKKHKRFIVIAYTHTQQITS